MLLSLLLGVFTQSCHKDDNPSSTTTDYNVYSSASTLVSAFSLKANSDVLSGLDSVHFVIDQDQALIYNADSLPVGTKVSALCVNVTCASTVKSKEFVVKDGSVQKDTTINYTSTTTDSIDFTGDVTLKITSHDGEHVRNYKVKVNVHKQEPDTIMWNASRRRDLPGVTGGVVESKTVRQADGNFLCLVDGGSSLVLSTSSDPMQGWSSKTLSTGFTPQVQSFAATASALYLLDEGGALYASTDGGDSWSSCGVTWTTLLGAYGDKVLGISNDGGTLMHAEFPAEQAPVALEEDFPVSDASQLVMASNEWTSTQQAMIVGGVLQDGTLSNDVWGYDGSQWGKISNGGSFKVLPGLKGAAMVPYYTYTVLTSNGYTTKRYVTWMVMGGTLENGAMNTTTYTSRDQGIHWNTGDSGVQLPSHIPAFSHAQAFVVTRTLTDASKVRTLAAYNPGQTTAITSWECPYIYLFGGKSSGGSALNNVWEGVLVRMTAKPVF